MSEASGAPSPERSSERVHLVAGILERDGSLLLVASRYPNHTAPLWNLPGGRQRRGELLPDALAREFAEETSLAITVGPLAYVAESYDRTTGTHFTAFVFGVTSDGAATLGAGDAHAVALAWVPLDDVAARLVVRVVREPLLAYLQERSARYHGYHDAGISIEFADPA